MRFFFGLERSDMGGMNAAAIPKDGAKQWNTVSKYVAPRECEYRTESIRPGTVVVVRFAKTEQKPNREKASGIKKKWY